MKRPSIAELVSRVNKKQTLREILCEVCGNTGIRVGSGIDTSICLDCVEKRNKKRDKEAYRKRCLAKQKTNRTVQKKKMTLKERKERETKRFYRDLEKANTAVWLSRVEVYGQGRTEKVPDKKLKASDFKFKQGDFNE